MYIYYRICMSLLAYIAFCDQKQADHTLVWCSLNRSVQQFGEDVWCHVEAQTAEPGKSTAGGGKKKQDICGHCGTWGYAYTPSICPTPPCTLEVLALMWVWNGCPTWMTVHGHIGWALRSLLLAMWGRLPSGHDTVKIRDWKQRLGGHRVNYALVHLVL